MTSSILFQLGICEGLPCSTRSEWDIELCVINVTVEVYIVFADDITILLYYYDITEDLFTLFI